MDAVEDPTARGSTIAPSLCCDSPGSNDPLLLLCNRGATALLVAVATPRLPRRSEAKLLQFVPINAHATWLSRSRAMATKRKTRQHSQLSQHGEFWHVSVS